MNLQYILQNPTAKTIVIVLIVIFSIALYTVKLGVIPTSVHGDEGETALQALDMLRGNTGAIGVGWFDLPLLSFAPHALGMKIFGENIIGNRAGSVVFGLLTLPIFFLFIRQLFSFQIGVIASILLGTSHLWIALSRLGITYTQASFLIICTLYFLFKAFRTKSVMNFVIAGAFLGLSFYSYYAVRILPIIILPSVAFYVFNKKEVVKNIGHIILFLIAAFIIFLPQGIFFMKNPESFSSRTKTVYIFSEIGRQWTNYNKTDQEVLVEQTKRTFNIFLGDNSTQYGYKGMLIDWVTLTLTTIGLLYIIIFLSKKHIFILLWLSFSLIGQILTTIPPPFFLPRFVIGLPALYVLSAIGLDALLKTIKMKKSLTLPITACVLIIIGGYNIYTYFVLYPKQIAGDLNARAATKIAYYLNSLPKSYSAIFVTPYQGYSNFGTLRFLSPHVKKLDEDPLQIDMNNQQNSVLGTKTTNLINNRLVYILYPNFRSKLRELRKLYPNGKIFSSRDINGQTQFYVLKI